MATTIQYVRMRTVLRRTVFLILLVMIASMVLVRPHIVTITSTGDNRELYDISVPGLDVWIDSIPATVDHAGYLEEWCYPHGADDITILFAIPGTPPLPVAPDTLEVYAPWGRSQTMVRSV